MNIEQELEDLKRECEYHESPEDADFEVNDSVDALIGYKDALEDLLYKKARESGQLARDLEQMLWPERFPPGHPCHNPDHIYWQGQHEYEPAFQWSSDTIEWVAQAVEREVRAS